LEEEEDEEEKDDDNVVLVVSLGIFPTFGTFFLVFVSFPMVYRKGYKYYLGKNYYQHTIVMHAANCTSVLSSWP
jgi:hypothetical protein